METNGIIAAQLEIGGLKARQLRVLDAKDWTAYAAQLTEDFVLDFGQGEPVRGRDAAVERIRQSVEGLTTVHHAHMPEFEFDGDEARVIWAMHDRIVRGPRQPSHSLYGYHHDRSVRRDGGWKMCALRLVTHHLDTHPPTVS